MITFYVLGLTRLKLMPLQSGMRKVTSPNYSNALAIVPSQRQAGSSSEWGNAGRQKASLVKGKGDLYSAFIVVHSGRSGIRVNYTIRAFTS